MKLTIIYNNESKPGLRSGWGFSCLVEAEKIILFDTGCEGAGLLYNIKKLGYDVKDIDIIVLSHQHWDHTGGLSDILQLNNKLKVFTLKSFSANLKNEIKKRAELVEIDEECEIIKEVYTTGLVKDNPDEQSLLLKTSKGVMVIVGCSHPGVDKILEIAKKHGKIYAVIGGFHGFSNLDALEDIEMIGACHCTEYKDNIRRRFPNQFRETKAGDIIE